MELEKFKWCLKGRNAVQLNEDIFLFKDFSIMDSKGNITKYDSLDDVLAIDGMKELIDKYDGVIVINGGRGAGYGETGKFKFSHAKGNGKDRTKPDFPARMNTKIKTKDFNSAMDAFRNAHVNDDYESGVTVDENGFITQYKHGNASSIAIFGNKGEFVLHNHPSGGHFSDNDLLSVSQTAAKGIVANTPKGDHIFTKTGHFNAQAFMSAVKRASLTGKDYDTAVTKWLKANSKTYGYTYTFRKAK